MNVLGASFAPLSERLRILLRSAWLLLGRCWKLGQILAVNGAITPVDVVYYQDNKGDRFKFAHLLSERIFSPQSELHPSQDCWNIRSGRILVSTRSMLLGQCPLGQYTYTVFVNLYIGLIPPFLRINLLCTSFNAD
jgi:hypothetical protein